MSISTRTAAHQQYQPAAYSNTSRVSGRASYPKFLPLSDSLLLQLRWTWHGLYDAFRWNVVISTIANDAEIRVNVYKSALLNTLSLISIYTFDFLLAPLVHDQQKWFHRNIGWFYQALWLFPVIGISFYLNSTWCSLIAKRTYTLQHGTQAAVQPSTYSGMLTAIATSAYRVIMVFTSLVVSFGLEQVPYIGPIVGFMFMCWMDSYYCFEFVWIARGHSLSRRVRHLEERWAYYFAFGLPSAAVCTWGTGLANAAIFALIFPAYIILAMHARPVPVDPYNPQPNSSGTVHHPSPFIPIRLPVFALVIWLNDLLVRVISLGGRGPPQNPNSTTKWSDTAESAEEGSNTQHKPTPSQRATTRTVKSRVNIGRRKLD